MTLGLLVIAAAATSPLWLFLLKGKQDAPAPLKVIALLPVQGVRDADTKEIVDRLTQNVADQLRKSGQLELIPADRVRSLGNQKNMGEMGLSLGVDFLVTERVIADTPQVRVQFSLLTSARPSLPAWIRSYELPRSAVSMSLGEKIAGDIRRAVLDVER